MMSPILISVIITFVLTVLWRIGSLEQRQRKLQIETSMMNKTISIIERRLSSPVVYSPGRSIDGRFFN
jgi:hypothetical protein